MLAAGALGTPFLLLRSRAALPNLSDCIGSRFGGNGDQFGFAFDTRDGARPRQLGASRAPVITASVQGLDGAGRDYHVQDAGYPGFVDWLMEASARPGLARRAAVFAWDWALAHLLRRPENSFGARLTALFGTGDRAASSIPYSGWATTRRTAG